MSNYLPKMLVILSKITYNNDNDENSIRRISDMAITTFAAIDVGSHETSLRIYEVSKSSGSVSLTMYIIRPALDMKHTQLNISAIIPLISSVLY